MTCCLSSPISLDLVSLVSNYAVTPKDECVLQCGFVFFVQCRRCHLQPFQGDACTELIASILKCRVAPASFLIASLSFCQTPRDPRGSTRWTGETIILCPLESRWRRTSRATASSRRDSTTVTCTGRASKVSARWLSKYVGTCFYSETEKYGDYNIFT